MPKVVKDNAVKRPLIKFAVFLAFILLAFVIFMNILAIRLNPLTSSNSVLSTKQDLEITVSTDKTTYKRSESMLLQLSVTNRTGKTVFLEFPSSQQYNFIVKREFDLMFFKSYLEIWQSSYKNIVKGVPSKLAIPPHNTKLFKDIWKLEDARGSNVPPGRYVIFGVLPATGGYKTELRLRTQTTK